MHISPGIKILDDIGNDFANTFIVIEDDHIESVSHFSPPDPKAGNSVRDHRFFVKSK
jgi:hypothetical protein